MTTREDRTIEDRWLSTLFGHPVFKLSPGLAAEDVRSVDAHVAKRRCGGEAASYYAKLPTTQVETTRLLFGLGFYVVDTAVTFELDTGKSTSQESPAAVAGSRQLSGPEVHVTRPEEAPAVLAIAGSCFRYSRFHLDPQVPPELAHRIKREWIESYVARRRGDRLFTATLDGRIAGFLAALVTAERAGKVATIDLVGVDGQTQGRGVGRALVQAFQGHYLRGFARQRVGTQAANIPSLALYQRAGFTIERTEFVLHLHIPTGSGGDYRAHR